MELNPIIPPRSSSRPNSAYISNNDQIQGLNVQDNFTAGGLADDEAGSDRGQDVSSLISPRNSAAPTYTLPDRATRGYSDFYEAQGESLPLTLNYERSRQSVISYDIMDPASPTFDPNSLQNENAKDELRKGKTIKAGDVPLEIMSSFFIEIDDLQNSLRFSQEFITKIELLHARLINFPSLDNPEAQSYEKDLVDLTVSLRNGFNNLSTRIKSLDQGNANLIALIAVDPAYSVLRREQVTDIRMKQVSQSHLILFKKSPLSQILISFLQQVQAIKDKFKDSISKYSIVERDQRAKQKQRLERQLKIVNPDMTDEEVNRIVRDSNRGINTTMFSQAVRDYHSSILEF